jgi:phospholipase/carboxylesterase
MKLTTPLESYFLPALTARMDYKQQPLVIVMHGKGDSLKPFKNFQEEMELPQLNFLLLNAPLRFQKGFSWYGEPPYQEGGVLRARKLVESLLWELQAQGFDLSKVFLLGFSQGSLVASAVALHFPFALGGVIGVSGYFHFSPRWRAQVSDQVTKVPWLLTHGRKDDVLPIEDTRLGLRKLQHLGLKMDWVESDKKHVFDELDYQEIRKWLLQKIRYPRKTRSSAKQTQRKYLARL